MVRAASSRFSFAVAAPFHFSQSIPEALCRSGEHRRAAVGRRPTVGRSISECRAQLVEIKCRSRRGLRVRAGQVAGAHVARVARLRRSRSARLRRYGSGSILFDSFGGLPSVQPGAARFARSSWCQGAGAASMRSTQASLTSRSSARRVSAVRCRTAPRAGAQRAR